jgi:hypothetical protein
MTINQKIKSLLSYFLLVSILFTSNMIQAQVQNDGVLHIGDNSIFSVGTGSFDFGSGTATTTRTKLDYGVIFFPNGGSCKGASDTHFIDGYAQTNSDTAFILPIGQSGVYAPIQVTASTSAHVDAAYFRSAPNSIGTIFEESISSISSVEYWDINSKGANTAISLSWSSSSAISDLTSSSLDNLTIVGYNGSTWVTIPSSVDEYSILGEISNLGYGSISTNKEIDLSAYSAFSLGTAKTTTNEQISNEIEYLTYINESNLYIEASSKIIAVEIYDIMGNKLINEKVDGQYTYNTPFQHEEAVYIALIRFEQGIFRTKKLMNSRFTN